MHTMTTIIKRPRTLAALIALGMASLITPPSAADPAKGATDRAPVDFTSKLVEGEQFRYSVRSREVRQRLRKDESLDKWISRVTLMLTCDVLAPDPEIGPRVRVTFSEVDCALVTPDRARRFTSEHPHMNRRGAPMTVAMEPVAGGSITLTLDERGLIRKVEGADELLKEPDLREYAELVVGREAIDRMIQPIFRCVAQHEDGEASGPVVTESGMSYPQIADISFEERWTQGRRDAGRVTFRVDGEATAEIDELWSDAVLSNSKTLGSYTWDELGGHIEHMEVNRFWVVLLENDPDGPSVAGEEVLTISAPIGEN